MRTQTLLSISTALFLGLMSFVFTGTEAAPVKMQAAQTKPAKATVLQTAQVNIAQAVLKPARTKGKLTLQVTLHNPTATRATAFGVQALHQGRVMGKMNIKGLNPRARLTRTLRNLPQQKGQRCVTVRLTKPRNSKLKLGTSRRVCLKSSMVIRGIGTSPGRKVGSRGKLGSTSKLGIKTVKGKTRLGVKYITINNTLTINGKNIRVVILGEQNIFVNWSFPSGLAGNPTGVNIRVHLGDFQDIPNECQTGGGDVWYSEYIPGLKGNFPINRAFLTLGQTYKVKACLIRQGAGNIGDESNTVILQYVKPLLPDLTVVNVDFRDNNKITFTVKNNSNIPFVSTLTPLSTTGKKLNYRITMFYYEGDTPKLRVFSGVARMLPSILYPNYTAPGFALLPSNIRDNLTRIQFVKVCINEDIPNLIRYQEALYRNNCKQRNW